VKNKLTNKILFVGGKGGVGKSTSAAALAWKLSQAGEKTLLISTDPAHNLGHIFNQPIGGKITNVEECLFALEIDPERETTNYMNGVKENMQGIVQPQMMEEVNRQLDTARASPGADEAALFDRLISVILEESSNFDKIVFDTAPTGHTIRLLTLPELMGVWIKGLLEKRQKTQKNYAQLLNDGDPVDDPIYDVLRERQQRFSDVRKILLDPKQTGFIFVLNPERLPILETEKALGMLAKYDLHVETILVNKVLPDDVDGDFFLKRREHEQQYVKQIEKVFQKQHRIYIPLFSRDILNRQKLEEFSHYF